MDIKNSRCHMRRAGNCDNFRSISVFLVRFPKGFGRWVNEWRSHSWPTRNCYITFCTHVNKLFDTDFGLRKENIQTYSLIFRQFTCVYVRVTEKLWNLDLTLLLLLYKRKEPKQKYSNTSHWQTNCFQIFVL